MLEKLKARLSGCKRSLTIWFNAIAGAAVLLLPVAQETFPQMSGYIPQDTYRLLMGIIIAANIVLRFKTTVDLAEKAAPK